MVAGISYLTLLLSLLRAPSFSSALSDAAHYDGGGLHVSFGAQRMYTLDSDISGRDFFDAFTWESNADPTHGRVNYVDEDTARRTNLSYASGNKFVMRADSDHVVGPSDRGRDSVRIVSKDAWDEFVVVLDLTHMPQGCGTWPAFWTLSQAGPWPAGGEIDIIEGVHLQTDNLATLHTSPNCVMGQWRDQSGATYTTDCDAHANGNQGCGVRFQTSNSYGESLNSVNGGYYAMEKSRSNGISIWYWPRYENIPSDVHGGQGYVDPRSWGQPAAYFPLDQCDYDSHFNAHSIIFDTTFCGDWAGAVWGSSGCPVAQSCNDYVDNNPGAFKKAYWEINSLRVYA